MSHYKIIEKVVILITRKIFKGKTTKVIPLALILILQLAKEVPVNKNREIHKPLKHPSL